MKKILASVLVLLALQLAAAPVFAAVDSEDISVNGKYVYTPAPGIAEADLAEGQYDTTVEGLPVTVVPEEPEDSHRLVLKVIPETHTEAHEWFGETLIDHGEMIFPMDIHFENQDGERVELHGRIEIRIKLPEGFVNPKVCYVSDEGDVTVMESTVSDGYISWVTDHNSYYVLVEKLATEPTTPTDPSTPTEPGTQPDTPTQPGSQPSDPSASTGTPGSSETGDQSDTTLWIVILAVSAVAIVILIVLGKRKKDE